VTLVEPVEFREHDDQNILHAFVVQRARQMVMVDDVEALLRPEDRRDHVPLDEFLAELLVRALPIRALALDLAHADRHLRRPQLRNFRPLQPFTRDHDHMSLPAAPRMMA
jgi:hypothetical protein